VAVVVTVGVGASVELMLRHLGVRVALRLVIELAAPLLSASCLGLFVTLSPIDTTAVLLAWSGSLVALLASQRRRRAAWLAVGLPVLALWGSVAGAGAWSVDEPPPSDPRMVAGNGIVVAVDTHAFLIERGAEILRADGRSAEADFLAAADPTAPYRRTADGRRTQTRESYLWRVELGARDADRVLKRKDMPDHFFNWWTHSGKGLVAGTSSATWAEQQFAQAVHLWRTGHRSGAMYRLGAATHLVDDACTPPHASPYVPGHRAYEEWVVAHQTTYAVHRGGIYRTDFRVRTGHGGDEWSSAHTRGWIDECAHRAAELIVNTAQPPPDDPADATSYENTMTHFEDAQRFTAGYLAFFFETVGGFAQGSGP
jgi:phospholipase C